MSSEALQEHVAGFPLVRGSILRAVSAFAGELAPGSRVLDAGAGDAPYAELFAHCDYVTADWPQSVHPGGRQADISASLDDLPVDEASFDAVLCTEVLEHVAEPERVLAELFRVLRPGGRLCLTTPFMWPLHEEPFDFYRYTHHAVGHLLGEAGFVEASVVPRSGYLVTLAQTAEMARWLGRTQKLRHRLSHLLIRVCAEAIRFLVVHQPGLDYTLTGAPLPIGYYALARKPG